MTNSTNYFRRLSSWIGAIAVLGLFLLAFPNGDASAAEARRNVRFDHVKTGFPLTGAHMTLPCETCHIQGTFKGTPKKCETCHAPGSRIQTATVKPANHIPTNQACSQCHSSTASWKVARFSHADVTPRQCGQCHNSSIVMGKPANHIPTSLPCDACHRTTTWMSAGFTHLDVKPGTCSTCHNGSQARGKHAGHIATAASCDQCHVTVAFLPASKFSHAGVTPGGCASCHNNSQASGKPSNHIPTSKSCDACHGTGITFATSTFAHSTTQGITSGSCATCHNGAYIQWNAMGKSANHVQTTLSCDSCHTGYVSFVITGSAFNHAGVTPGSCITCHNGSQARGKVANHIPTTLSCDACHSTGGTFTTSTFRHSATQGVIAGQCATCHNGSYTQWNALGKSANHVTTTASCDTCHTGYTTFAGAGFNHTGVAPGTCANCHNGSQAIGKPGGHFVTTRSCDACHHSTATGGFQQAVTTASYSHTSPFYKTHNSGVACIGCHTTNNEVLTWQFSAYKPDCAGCHAGRFKPDSHKKTESPSTILYTVSELKNCAGSCHIYTDNTFTTIKTTRSGHHRSTDGGF